MEASAIYWTLLGINWAIYLFELYLDYRQFKVHENTEKRPAALKDLLTKKKFALARRYKLDRHRFGFIFGAFNQVQTFVFTFCGVMPLAWYTAGKYTDNEIIQTIYFLVLTTVVDLFISLPFGLYDTFVIEERHGFNQQTLVFYLTDKAKKVLLNFTLTIPILSTIIWLVQWGGDYFFFYLWLFISAIIFLLMTIYPEFIAPLFDKYVPLPESDLKVKIEALAKRVGFPLTKLYVVQGSKRSSHSNAYMYGFWNNKRIVLYDTLLNPETIVQLFGEPEKKSEETTPKPEADVDVSASSEDEGDADAVKNRVGKGMTDDEVVAVLGHEIGHWRMKHTVIQLTLAEINLFIMLYIFGNLYHYRPLFEAFGFNDDTPTFIGLMLVFQLILAVYSELFGIAQSFMSRRMEFDADRFSADLGYADSLGKALIKLGVDNLSLPVDDPIYSAVHHSHPPIPERLNALKKTL